jgi:hypothetical protein
MEYTVLMKQDISVGLFLKVFCLLSAGIFFFLPITSHAVVQTINGATGQNQSLATTTGQNSMHMNITRPGNGNTHQFVWDQTPWTVTQGGTGATSFTNGSIPFIFNGIFSQDNLKFLWDTVSSVLKIGGSVSVGSTSSPQHALDVTGSYYSRLVSLVDNSTIDIDWDAGNTQTVTLGGNRTLALSDGRAGGEYSLILKQDSTGGRTVVWPSDIKWPSGVAPTLSSDPSAIDIVRFLYDGSDYLGTYDLNLHDETQEIAVDTTSITSFANTNTASVQHTTSGGNRILLAGLSITNAGGSDVSPSMTYNGSPMTLIGTAGGTFYRVYLFYIVAPELGPNTLAASWTGNYAGRLVGASYTGAKQTNQPDTYNTHSGTTLAPSGTITVSTTVNEGNSWMVGVYLSDSATVSAGSGTTLRVHSSIPFFDDGIMDSNGPVGTGSSSLTINVTDVGTTEQDIVVAAISPAF